MLIINTIAMFLEESVLTYGDPYAPTAHPYALFLCMFFKM